MSNETSTMSVGDCLGNDGPLPTVTWNGKTYKVYRNCPDVVAYMEQEVARQALANLESLKGVYSPEKYAAKEQELDNALFNRHHGFGGPLFMAALSGPQSVAHLLAACIKPGDESFTLADAVKMVGQSPSDVVLALKLVCADFFDHGADRMGIPREQIRPRVKELLTRLDQAQGMLTGQAKVKPKKK